MYMCGHMSAFQIHVRGGIKDNSNINCLIQMKKYIVTSSLEPSCGDGSSEGSQCMFLQINKENYPCYPSFLEHCM